ncbi:uncharacterized protein LOC107408523 isoform X2 [Ziziphus jujuba]|uniref:Uncharacterized protein LOC107408523 isoform X2 n=1 Tax=Ziziphus jujuba TaxID=326968 RepID=A0ABM3IUT0_ZIZJJ|nr:uncharacterized protein LOC107408523 isoform X2 [Ziziphus jujuba]
MKSNNHASAASDSKNRSCLCSLLILASLICGAYFIGAAFTEKEYQERLTRWPLMSSARNNKTNICQNQCWPLGTAALPKGIVANKTNKCQNQCWPLGTAALPKGIVAKTSNLEMQPLWGSTVKNKSSKSSKSLLAIAAGIKQKEVVNQIVKKFSSSDFVVMLFHYDGHMDEWRDLAWSDRAIHVSAVNQTKWWFAKRFLHPDIVAEYDYIFLWDEDLGVENFDPKRYLSIVRDEGLEISQPALDPAKSVVYHQITARLRGSRVHRRIYKLKGKGRCDNHSSSPPCVGWVEIMAPVFSRAAWRCVWYMIQNDLIHAWGLDMLLGYCSQGNRTKTIGVVDAEYVAHLALPTLGASDGKKEPSVPKKDGNNRIKVRMQSFIEMGIFKERWNNAVKADSCWVDPYRSMANQSSQ